jgi:hypothetical protein
LPTNRTPIYRERRPVFSAEALALFARLEAMPPRQRDEQEQRRLARLLGLTPERWMGCDVLDRSRRACCPESCAAFDAWHKVRRVREALLAAVSHETRA